VNCSRQSIENALELYNSHLIIPKPSYTAQASFYLYYFVSRENFPLQRSPYVCVDGCYMYGSDSQLARREEIVFYNARLSEPLWRKRETNQNAKHAVSR
jgi:hypothetical protein